LPARAARAILDEPHRAGARDGSEAMKTTVLICDDAKIMRVLMRAMLEPTGYFEIVGEAANGVEVVAEYKKLRPGLVILDLNLPIRDGQSAAREILELNPDASILVTTTKAQKAKVDALEAMGVKHAIYKPLQAEEFVRAAMKASAMV
jgi:two-component system chemotaxis response regulator CheY